MRHQTVRQLGSTLHAKGVSFEVWAPFAKSVSLLLTVEFDAKEIPMTATGDGYWALHEIDAEPGQSYQYRITTQDGRQLDKNDPYARQLTNSDTGKSVIIDPEFDWGEGGHFMQTSANKTIIYELHIGSFNKPDAATSGTFESAIEKLDYIASLGATHIELMPVTSMATSNGWGYAPNYIFSVENSYGGRHGLLRFVKACHEKGIAVILDVVYNHFFKETDLWQYDGWSEHNRGGIYFYNDERGDTPWGGRPDYGRPEVRTFILDNVAMWFNEYKIDGLRVDSTIYMRTTQGDNNDPKQIIDDAWTLLQAVNTLARKINPHALMIAEDNTTNPAVTRTTQEAGAGFDAEWEVGFPHVIRDSLGITTHGNDPKLEGIVYELNESLKGHRFHKIIFSDSHDTAANGSVRLNEAVSPGNAESVSARQRVLLASTLALTTPGIPMLLQGQEFMQEGAFNDWKMLEWNKTQQFAGIVLAHQHLINLRLNRFNNTAGLVGPHAAVLHRDDTNGLLAYHRWDQGGVNDDTIIVVNCGPTHFTNYDMNFPRKGLWRVRFNSSWSGYSVDFKETPLNTVIVDDTLTVSVRISAYSAIILSLEEE